MKVRVHVVDKGRSALYMRYRDPVTGKEFARSTGETKRKDALKAAAKWEAELNEGRYKPASKITWQEFRDRYDNEALTALATSTANRADTILDSVEEVVCPARLTDLTADKIVVWQQYLRDGDLSEATIKSYTGQLKAALRWAQDIGLLVDVPKIRMPQRAKGGRLMKGRPVTGEEFDRLLAAIPDVITDEPRQEAWRFLLRGLWWSGLRLGEALELSWEGSGLVLDLTGRRPMLRIPAGSEKGHKDRLLPLAPEAAALFQSIPECDRTGHVFTAAPRWGSKRLVGTYSKLIIAIGNAAGIKVLDETRKGKNHTKTASAHDLRRAFGLRWALRVMPAVLQQLMRHESIETTMRYYVGRDAEVTADILWAAVEQKGDTSGDISPSASSKQVIEAQSRVDGKQGPANLSEM